MITQLILDTEFAKAGTPVRFVDWLPALNTPQGRVEMVAIELPDGREVEVDAGYVSSGVHSPEEIFPELARRTGIGQSTLEKAAKSNPPRLMARKSGETTWLSTVNAVEWAIAQGQIRQQPH